MKKWQMKGGGREEIGFGRGDRRKDRKMKGRDMGRNRSGLNV